jgi:hypothetical protein
MTATLESIGSSLATCGEIAESAVPDGIITAVAILAIEDVRY